MKEKENNFIAVNNGLIFKNLFGTNKNIKFTIDMLESLFTLEEGTLKGVIENDSKLDKETIINRNFKLGAEVLLSNKDKLGIEIKNIYEKNRKIMQITGLYYSSFEEQQILNLPKKLEIYKKSDTVDVCILRNKENPEDTLYENTFNIIIIDLQTAEKYHKNKKFENWRKFISATSVNELESLSKTSAILKEAYEEYKKFINLDYVQKYCEEQRLIDKKIEYVRDQTIMETKEEIALKMVKRDKSIQEIIELTGLSKEQIKELMED